jgi:hypothetical protein
MREHLSLLLLCAGCGPLTIGYVDTDARSGPVDSRPGDTEPPDTSMSLPDCQTTDWPDKAVTVNKTCTLPPAVMELERMWVVTHPRLLSADGPYVGRFVDADEDGEIGPDDPVSIAVMTDGTENYLDSGPTLLDAGGDITIGLGGFEGASSNALTLGDLEPARVGIEALAGSSYRSDATPTLAVLDEYGLISSVELDHGSGVPWLVDLDADGQAEVLFAGAVRDATTGEVVVSVEGGADVDLVLAADLDLDGQPELVGFDGATLAIWSADGTQRPTVSSQVFSGGAARIAVGNLDEDAFGELVIAVDGWLLSFDSDGRVINSLDLGYSDAFELVLAELDGDPLPEIVATYRHRGSGYVVAFEDDLSPLWTLESEDDRLHHVAADLDGDGLHELVVAGVEELTILDHDGGAIATAELFGVGNDAIPVVIDLDGDDLAEILVYCDCGFLSAYESPTGGWAVRGADMPWPGSVHFPGDRDFDGGLPDPSDAHWLRPGENVWQGLAAGAPDLPDLGIEIVEVCAEKDGVTRVTAYLGNHGLANLREPVQVVLERPEDDQEFTRVSSPRSLASGLATAVQLEASLGSATDRLRVRVDSGGEVAECGDVDNSAEVALDDFEEGSAR